MRFLPLPLIASAAPAFAQAAAPAPGEVGTSLLQVLLGLAVVIALLLGGLWLLKRLSAPRGAAAGMLRIIAGTAVGPRERVVLVEVGDTWLVVGVAPGQVRALHQLPRQEIPPDPAAPYPAGKDFASRLKQVLERRNGR